MSTEEKEAPKKESKRVPKTKGVVMMAFGKKGYYYAAFNMALSIKKHNPNIKIALIHDGTYLKELHHTGYFDKLITLNKEDLYDNGITLSPAKAKVSIYKYLPWDHNLYLDVDGIALQDVEPLLDQCMRKKKPYLTEVRGIGAVNDTVNYAIWASLKTVWKFFSLPKSGKYPAIQSSFAYINKSNKAEEIFDKAIEFYNMRFPVKSLTMQWGGTIPDELIFSAACTALKYNPDAGVYPIFFGWKHVDITFTQMAERYTILSLYGNGKGHTLTKRHYIEHYDKLMRAYSKAMGMPHSYKTVYIMRDKHAG